MGDTGSTPAQPFRERDYGIDALRGVAILMMLAAHLARDVLATPHPLWLRAYGSLAAPLFITLAGMMVGRTAARKHQPASYYVKWGAMIVAVAVALDVFLWGLYPFVTFDVLYLIGFSVPLAALFTRFSPGSQTGILVLVLMSVGIDWCKEHGERRWPPVLRFLLGS